MKYDYTTCGEVKRKINLHDAILLAIMPDVKTQHLIIHFRDGYRKEVVTKLVFSGVLYFEMTNYCPWGFSKDIQGIGIEDHMVLLNRVKILAKESGKEFHEEDILYQSLMQPVIEFSSGDVLRVLCTLIEVEEQSM